MADLEKKVKSTKELIDTLLAFIDKEKCAIRLLNLKVVTEVTESRWYCDVNISYDGENLCIIENGVSIFFKSDELKKIKIRPFYYAACIGNKNLVFHLDK